MSRRINLIGGTAYSSTGGIQQMNRTLVQELAQAGRLRRAFFLWDDAWTGMEEGRRMKAEGWVRLYDLARGAFLKDLLTQALRYPSDFWICTHVNYAFLGILVGLLRGKKVAVMLHAAELDDDVSWLKSWALRRAGLMITVSEYTKRKALALGVRPERVHILHNGVADPCPEGPKSSSAASAPMVLFVGRMDERYKGQMELLDAMVILRRRLPRLHLVFVGGGRSLDYWRREAELRDLSGMVEFAGRVSEVDLRSAYERAALFAMPSENEGFGLVYAEAMAHGLPCIGSDRDAAREVIVDGATGYCVPAGNAVVLADAIQRVVDSPALRANMGSAGRRRFEENFTTAKYRERLLDLMQSWTAVAA